MPPCCRSDGLNRSTAQRSCERVAGGKKLPPDIADRILANTEGVPLFVEELTRTVLDSGLLVEAGDRYLPIGPLPALAIPSTLQDSLMARLDRLSPIKETAQIGACIGRVFQHRLLAAVSGTNQTQLDDALNQLEQAELVFRSGAPPDATYTFKHALVRDTAYQSLLKSRRQQIHGKDRRRAGSRVRRHRRDRAGDGGAALHAGRPGCRGRAVVAEGRPAGDDQVCQPRGCGALRQRARACCIPARFRDPFEAGAFTVDCNGLGPDPRQRLGRSGGPARVFDCARTCRAAWGQSPAVRRRPRRERLPYHLWPSARRRNARHAVPDARHGARTGFRGFRATCWRRTTSSGASTSISATTRPAQRMPNKAWPPTITSAIVTLPGAIPGTIPGVCCRSFSAQMLCICGKPDSAIRRSREAIALAERDSHPVTWPRRRWPLASSTSCDASPARDDAGRKRQSRCAPSSHMPLLLGQADVFFGWALAGLGQLDEGIRQMREGIAAIAGTGADMGMAYYLCALARACGEHGDAKRGARAAGAGVRHARQISLEVSAARAIAHQGRVAVALDPADEAAEGWFRQSLAAAREQGARLSELRAALRLARLMSAAGARRGTRPSCARLCGVQRGFRHARSG